MRRREGGKETPPKNSLTEFCRAKENFSKLTWNQTVWRKNKSKGCRERKEEMWSVWTHSNSDSPMCGVTIRKNQSTPLGVI